MLISFAQDSGRCKLKCNNRLHAVKLLLCEACLVYTGDSSMKEMCCETIDRPKAPKNKQYTRCRVQCFIPANAFLAWRTPLALKLECYTILIRSN